MQTFSHLSKPKMIKGLLALALVAALGGWLISATGGFGSFARAGTATPGPAASAAQMAKASLPSTSPPRLAQNAAPLPGSRSPAATAQTLSQAFRDAAKTVMPAVVTIRHTTSTTQETSGPGEESGKEWRSLPFGNIPELRKFFKDMPETPRRSETSMGSGVIIDKSGIVLTNNHVVDGGGRLTVQLPDGRQFETSAVKTDPESDLAVVMLKGAHDLPVAQLGNSDNLQIGDWVLAIGNPFGLSDTVTAGIISAKSRGLGEHGGDYLQTDAPINPGNSGGPLVNLNGKVVGIDTAISTTSGGYQGVGFAIPSNFARWVSGQLISHGKVERAYLGVGIQELTPELASQLGFKGEQRGVVVTNVFPNTPGSAAGLKSGDVIVKFGDQPVTSPRRLKELVEESKMTSRQTLEVLRDQKPLSLTVTLQAMPSGFGEAAQSSEEGGSAAESAFHDLGIHVAPLTGEKAAQLGLTHAQGILITSVDSGSVADQAGLSDGMVISKVGQTPVKTVDEFRAAVAKQSLKKGILLLVNSKEGSMFVVLRAS